MGYYTYHELLIIEGDDHKTEYGEEIAEVSGYSCPFEEHIKWYDCHKDMKEYSKKHPNTVFEVSGEGEEAGDLWKAYFKNGKMQLCRAKITFEEYDPSKLA